MLKHRLFSWLLSSGLPVVSSVRQSVREFEEFGRWLLKKPPELCQLVFGSGSILDLECGEKMSSMSLEGSRADVVFVACAREA